MKILTFFMLLLITACTSDNLVKYQPLNFPQEEELTYTPIARNIPSRYILDLFVTDSALILEGNDLESFFFAYDKATGRHLQNFFKIGRGPFEGVAPNLIAINGDSCVITESNLTKGWSFSLSGLLSGKNDFYREFRFQFPEERAQMMASNAINLGNHNYIIDIPFTAEERFAIISNPYSSGEKNIKHLYKTYPKITPEADSVNAIVLSYINKFTASPGRTKFVTLSFIGAIAETFELRQDTLLPIAVKWFIKPEYDIFNWNAIPRGDAIMGFGSVIASDNNFYAIFYNNEYNAPANKNTIAVFDWKINPVKLYTVNDWLVTMKLDPESRIVYAVIKNRETKEYDLVKFDKQFIE